MVNYVEDVYLREAIEIVPRKLFFLIARRPEVARAAAASGTIVHIDRVTLYEPFYADFGPINAAERARDVGLWDWADPNSTFDVNKYDHYEQVQNGDWNWIVPNKCLAFSGPTCQRRQHALSTLGAEDYVPVFKAEGVTAVVRLNRQQYDRRPFLSAGLRHYDLYFPDGTCPPDNILAAFLSIAEAEPGAVAVHCKAGLGRTGSLIGCYIMKHFGFTAEEVVAYIRICRPGSILGPQQLYMKQKEREMWSSGSIARSPVALLPQRPPSPRGSGAASPDVHSNGIVHTYGSGRLQRMKTLEPSVLPAHEAAAALVHAAGVLPSSVWSGGGASASALAACRGSIPAERVPALQGRVVGEHGSHRTGSSLRSSSLAQRAAGPSRSSTELQVAHSLPVANAGLAARASVGMGSTLRRALSATNNPARLSLGSIPVPQVVHTVAANGQPRKVVQVSPERADASGYRRA